MTAFIFLGDMLVMLFMISVVVWLTMVETDEQIDYTARIPLHDDPGDKVNHG
jgi:cbb3-type cytochrome oxidase subunit 3